MSNCPMKTCFKNGYMQSEVVRSLGLLGFRVVMGAAFIAHGMGKIENPTGWMGDAPIPGIMQAFAAYAEYGGGILLLLGLLTPLASLALIGTMLGALFIAHLPAGDPFVGPNGSYELALVYLAGALLFLLNSPGRFSLDTLLAGRLKPGDAKTS